MSKNLLIRNGVLIDPVTGRQSTQDLFVQNGRIAEPTGEFLKNAHTLDASGLLVTPAFWDLHVHLREPGNEAAETIKSGCEAAARGGFSTVVAMPNTQPPADTPDRVAYVLNQAAQAGVTRVLPTGCLTLDRVGCELTDFKALKRAGVVALTDDGTTPADESLMYDAAAHAAELDLLIMDHAHDPLLEKRGVMHEGPAAARWGLPGIPVEAERSVVERDIRLAEQTGARLHIQHVSSAAACDLIREARRRGVSITAEATPHHLALCDDDVDPTDASYKMNPPLRSAGDREALLKAVCDGTIIALATDHAPHTAESKARGFREAPFGVVGLETAIGVTHRLLVESGRIGLIDWVRLWTTGPARILKREPPSLAVGAAANLVLLDLKHEWVVTPSEFASRSRNTPFSGWRLRARAVVTIFEGRLVWSML